MGYILSHIHRVEIIKYGEEGREMGRNIGKGVRTVCSYGQRHYYVRRGVE